MKDYAKFLFQRRKELKLTQRELAKLANVNRKTVIYYERGSLVPSYRNLERILDACGYTLQIAKKGTQVMSKMNVGKKLCEARIEAGLSQYHLSLQTGIRESTISCYENGKHSPRVDKLEALLDICGYELRIVKKGSSE